MFDPEQRTATFINLQISRLSWRYIRRWSANYYLVRLADPQAPKSSTDCDMPVLKRALQAPPLSNSSEIYAEIYRSHKKFRAARKNDETRVDSTTAPNHSPAPSPTDEISRFKEPCTEESKTSPTSTRLYAALRQESSPISPVAMMPTHLLPNFSNYYGMANTGMMPAAVAAVAGSAFTKGSPFSFVSPFYPHPDLRMLHHQIGNISLYPQTVEMPMGFMSFSQVSHFFDTHTPCRTVASFPENIPVGGGCFLCPIMRLLSITSRYLLTSLPAAQIMILAVYTVQPSRFWTRQTTGSPLLFRISRVSRCAKFFNFAWFPVVFAGKVHRSSSEYKVERCRTLSKEINLFMRFIPLWGGITVGHPWDDMSAVVFFAINICDIIGGVCDTIVPLRSEHSSTGRAKQGV